MLDLEQQETPGFGNENKYIDLIHQQVKAFDSIHMFYILVLITVSFQQAGDISLSRKETLRHIILIPSF